MVFVYVAKLFTFFWTVVCTVEEAILIPGSACELSPFDVIGEQLAGRDVHDINLYPVGAATLNGVGEIFAVVRLRSAR